MADEKRRPALAKLPAFQPGTRAPTYITWESVKFPFHVVVSEYSTNFYVEVFFGSAQIPVWKYNTKLGKPFADLKERDEALLSIEVETAAYLKKAASELRSWIMPF